MPLRRVLDLSWSLGGSYCTRLLSAAGVSVVKAEPPGGHRLRRWRASGAPVAAGATGALWGWLAGGQETMTVDPADAVQTARLLDWVGAVDAVVWTPGSPLTAPGVADVAAVRRAAGDGVVVTLTPFGLEGPWAGRPATEFTLQALSGGPALRGWRDWPPMTAGGQHGEWMAGVVAAVAAMVGMHRRTVGGGGGLYDVSALEAVIMTQLFNPITGETMEDGRHPRRPRATVGDVHPSRDGYVGFAVVNRLEHWHQFCRMVGHPEWAEDASLDPVVDRTDRADELNPAIEEWTTARTTAEIVEVATRMRVPATEVGNGRSLPHMDHFASEGFYERNPADGFLQPAPPWRFSPPVPGAGQCRPAPSGVRPLGPPPPRRAPAMPAGHVDPDRPLAGLRVADFTSFWAGPFLTHTLGMLGADVIHVESAHRPDGSRFMNYRDRTHPRWWEWSAYFQATNTNKRGLTLDMRTEAGRDLGRRLAASCDVVVENYSPRVLESWGITWEALHAANPATVMVRMPAFGLRGPWRDRTGFAMTMEQVSGMAWLSGFPEHRPGALFGPCDPGAGLHTAVGLLAAIEHRRHTGTGMLVEAPMVASALNVTAEQVIEYSAYGALLSRDGNRGPAACPQNLYRTATRTPDGDQDRWVAVAVETDEQWQALVRAVGSPEWAVRPELGSAGGRHRHRDLIDERLAEWCASRPDTEIVERLWPAGVPVAPVVHPIEQLGFDQLHARRFFESVEHPVCGTSIHVTYPFRLPGYEAAVHRRPAPTLGQHSDEILRDVLGLDPDEITALHHAGVVGEELTG